MLPADLSHQTKFKASPKLKNVLNNRLHCPLSTPFRTAVSQSSPFWCVPSALAWPPPGGPSQLTRRHTSKSHLRALQLFEILDNLLCSVLVGQTFRETTWANTIFVRMSLATWTATVFSASFGPHLGHTLLSYILPPVRSTPRLPLNACKAPDTKPTNVPHCAAQLRSL